MAQYHSGWSADDMEKLCQSLYEADTKGVFKWTECWKVLKENPKWLDYANKMMGKRSRSNEGSTSRTQAPSSDSPFNESAPIDLTSDTSTPSLNLDGPASRDVERPIGIKSAKVNNQRQRRIRQHSKSQASVSQSLTAGMMSLESASSIRWEMLAEADRTRDLKDDERYNDMKRMQAVEREVVGEKLLAAIQKLDQIDLSAIVTDSQRLVFDVRKKAVEDYQEQYEELGKLLKRIKNYSSPSSAPSEDNIPSASVGTIQRRLFADDEPQRTS